ncbi:MAG: efflux transporter outer membrane subunit [Myxococcales bacterium]|nr:efflux transporter outer membrane subunit [Myxococcales bacterium]
MNRPCPPLWIAMIAFAGAGPACSPHGVTERPASPVELPASHGAENAAATPAEPTSTHKPERWWRDFGDPELDRLIDAGLQGNFDLHAAWARFAQAQATADEVGAPRWPSLDAELGASISSRPFIPSQPPQQIRGFSASLRAGYELDVWNRIGSGIKAAALDRDAAADAVQAMAITLSAEVTEAYLDLAEVRARRKMLERQREISGTFVELLQLRFGQGLSSAVEVNQQRQGVLELDAQLELTHSAEAVAAHRLALLLGKAPGSLALGAREDLPQPPPLPALGIPSELLQRRPDVRAARRRVEAADHRVAAAVAARLPSLRLTGSITSSPNNRNNWLLDPAWNLAAGLLMPLIDGGSLAARAERQRAVLSEAVASYGDAIVSALTEVQNALVQSRQQRLQIETIESQLEVATVTLEQARQRYSNGLTDFLTVLTALRSQQQVELSLLAAQRRQLSHRIQLYRALGGTWTRELEQPQLLKPTAGDEDDAETADTGAGGAGVQAAGGRS